MRVFSAPLFAVAIGCVVGCGGSDSPSPTGGGGSSEQGVGGSQPTGGAAATGGAVATGGNVPGTGGAPPATGGNGTGGNPPATGGRATGGSPVVATGGNQVNATGGAGIGGGGPVTGGTSPVTATGGQAAGGKSAVGGGSSAGGKSAVGGGSSAGGKSATGGATNAGGQATGGSPAAGGGATKSSGCGTTAAATTGNGKTISVGGTNRTYNLKLPDSYDMNKAYRLIVSIHWLNGTAQNVTDGNYYGLWSLSQNSTVFVAPQGINNGWSNSGGSDTTFIKALITQLEGQLCINTASVLAEGFSMGGSMSYALASAAPDVFRAVAVHSGGPMSGTTAGHSKPVAYFMTHGTQDSVCTYPGYGVPQLQDFAKVNGCKTPDPTLSATAFEAALPNPTSSAGACVDFTGCTEGYPVRSCLFVGDHTASPSGNWVPTETWKFLSQF